MITSTIIRMASNSRHLFLYKNFWDKISPTKNKKKSMNHYIVEIMSDEKKLLYIWNHCIHFLLGKMSILSIFSNKSVLC